MSDKARVNREIQHKAILLFQAADNVTYSVNWRGRDGVFNWDLNAAVFRKKLKAVEELTDELYELIDSQVIKIK